MTAPAPEPWGKLDRNAPDPATAPRLSLVAHCIDVAAVMAALLALPTLQARLAAAAGRPLTRLDRERLVALAFLHDPGKCGAGFYARALSNDLQAAWRRVAQPDGQQRGHVAVVAPLLVASDDAAPLRSALGVDDVLAWGGASESARQRMLQLWLASLSHHGKPLTSSELENSARGRRWPTWTVAIDGYEPAHGLQQLGNAARVLFPDAYTGLSPFEPVQPALAHAFAGLVSLADWIGSCTDAGYFPYDLGDTQTLARWPAARATAVHVLRAMRIDLEAPRADLRARAPGFASIFAGHTPHDAQQRTAQAPASDSVVVIEAETGSGKTEAALWRFKTLFEAGAVDALCFLLPTRVAATGIYTRIQTFMQRLFPDPTLRPTTVLAVPGYLRANGADGRYALTGFEVLWPDVPEPERTLYWAAENSKRYFAGSAVAATIDQFLLSTLQTKHAHMRASLALRALVVVDEVHASDPYMTTLLKQALQRHVEAGGHALLMSATLTGDARAALLTAGAPVGMTPRRAREHQSRLRTALATADAPYPCISSASGLAACAGADRVKRVRINLLPVMRDADAVACEAAAAAAQGARVLVLRNTVRQAIATQLALETLLGTTHSALFAVGRVVALHHGRYAFEDRRRLDAAVEAQFGKDAAQFTVPRILVGTQTLEISVDCDADLMITDIVPIDVLLQRMGRLHRHAARDAWRSQAVQQPRLVVLTPPERDMAPLLTPGGPRGLGLGKNSAYPNLLAVEATWQLLQACGEQPLTIPADNRRLVEAGVSVQALDALAERLGGPWPQHFNDTVALDSAQAAQALPVMAGWREPFGKEAWSDLGEAVRTRLGLDGVDVTLPKPWTSPFGCELRTLTAPAWMLGHAAGAAVVEQDRDADHIDLLVGDVALRYDRHGLQSKTTN